MSFLVVRVMAHILDGNSDHAAHVWRKTVFFENVFKFETVVELKKCLKQIKLPILPYTCAPDSEIPTNIHTMVRLDSTRKINITIIDKQEELSLLLQSIGKGNLFSFFSSVLYLQRT